MSLFLVIEANRAYGALVARVLPNSLLGFFAAVVVGSILSTFNSVLNSAATLFSLDVYKVYLAPEAENRRVVFSGQLCSFIVALFAAIAAPVFFHQRGEVFGYFQKLNAVYFIPLLAVIMVGMFHRYANGVSAMITLILGLLLMLAGTFLSPIPGSEFDWVKTYFVSGYHYAFAVFALLTVIQIIFSAIGMRRSEPYIQADLKAVDLTPWTLAPLVSVILVLLATGIYVFFAF